MGIAWAEDLVDCIEARRMYAAPDELEVYQTLSRAAPDPVQDVESTIASASGTFVFGRLVDNSRLRELASPWARLSLGLHPSPWDDLLRNIFSDPMLSDGLYSLAASTHFSAPYTLLGVEHRSDGSIREHRPLLISPGVRCAQFRDLVTRWEMRNTQREEAVLVFDPHVGPIERLVPYG